MSVVAAVGEILSISTPSVFSLRKSHCLLMLIRTVEYLGEYVLQTI